MIKRHNVKSFEKETSNFHKKSKDYQSDSEMKTFLEASKKTDIKNETPFTFKE